MGFLDHTTNNIIIDAVLTERGRELLARNDGSFRIDAFALGDDEIDYSNIVKYGNNIGKEKIEKNTPIFEAQTNETLALKYNNITLSNSNLRILYVPTLQKITPATSNISLTLNNTTNSVVFQTIEIISTLPKESGQNAIDSNLADLTFEVKMNSLLLSVYNSGLLDTSRVIDEDENFVKTYRIDGTPSYSSLAAPNDFTLSNRYKLKFDIGLISNLNNSSFEKFGTLTSNNNTLTGIINTYIEIIGLSSGSRILIPIEITLN
jgi:hypothetical protein